MVTEQLYWEVWSLDVFKQAVVSFYDLIETLELGGPCDYRGTLHLSLVLEHRLNEVKDRVWVEF